MKFQDPSHADAENSADLHLLTDEEKEFCRLTRLQPKPYLMIKETVLAESIANGGFLKKKSVRELCKLDPTKGGKLFDFFVQCGWIGKA